MTKKIIVAGGGHGGIATAMLLAKAGFQVEVFEKNPPEKMGYDWTDIFAPEALARIGLPMPPADKFEYKTNMTFYAPNEKKAIVQRVPRDELEIKMERRDIYAMLINAACEAGVKFTYNCRVNRAIIGNGRVAGINTSLGDFYGDLVIDAAGCESPVRSSLPREWGIQAKTGEKEKFYVYRAFFNKTVEGKVQDPYKVLLLPEGRLGVGWIATEEKYTDLLIGRFEKFDLAEAQRFAAAYRVKNPSLGETVLRGGSFVEIPVRQPLAIMVANGYAAIGDSAFMTVPIIGSGIANTLKAAPLLAKVIAENSHKEYTAKVLWEYQRLFYKSIGSGLAPMAQVKLLLTRITPEQLNYVFEKGILTYREMTITANTTSLSKLIKPSFDMPAKGLAIAKNPVLTRQLLGVAGKVAAVMATTAQMPRKYEPGKVKAWAEKYESLFK